MSWKVELIKNVAKQLNKLPEQIKLALRLLVQDLKRYGPVPGKQWPNYSKLKGGKSFDRRHCHLIKGKPTYICCWLVIDKQSKTIEVY